MKRPAIHAAIIATTLAAILGPVVAPTAHATATASAQLTFTNFSITPSSGTLFLLSNWVASAYAQASTTSDYDTGDSPRMANATGDFSFAHGESWTAGPLALDVWGQAGANASVPGMTPGSDTAAGRGGLSTYFIITGGAGSVNALFSVDLTGNLNVFTDQFGEYAEAETIFVAEVAGTPVLFDHRFHAIETSDAAGETFTTTLNQNVPLQFNTVYFLYLEADAEVLVSNVPEPHTAALALCGWLLVTGLRWRARRRRSGAKSLLGGGLLNAAVLFGLAVPARAAYLGSEAPQICLTCDAPQNRARVNNTFVSYSEGNLYDQYPVVSVRSSGEPTLSLRFDYNSYNADGSRAELDVGMGLGWTHSYNDFLFSQRGHLFRMDGSGRVAQFRYGPGGVYQADPGYFETLAPQPDGSFVITNLQQGWSRYAPVPNTPFLVNGPVYRLTHRGDRNGNLVTLAYTNGVLASVTDVYGRALWFGYTNGNKLATVTDPLGRVTRIQYDPLFRVLTRITDADGKVTRYSYNSSYQMTRKIESDGRMYFYTYKHRKPFAVLDGEGQTIFSMTNPQRWGTDRTALALFLRRQYVPATTTLIDGRGLTWRYAYDTNGYITRVVAPDGTVTSYAYDPVARNVSAVTNANGAVTRYFYDNRGNRTNVTDALGNSTLYTYEPVFNQLVQAVDANGRTNTYAYDERGNRTNAVDALGQTTRFTYNPNGQILSQTDKRGNVTTYAYDAEGNRISMTDPLGQTTTYTYDGVGNLTSVTDPLGRTTHYAYDARDRLIRETNALGGVTQYQYDAADRRVAETDPLGRVTRFEYDTRGRLIGATNALGGVTQYFYDGNNNRTRTVDPLGRVTAYEYDSLNRLIRTTNALGGVTSTTYDPVGNRISETDANGNTTTYAYDALNRLVATTNALGGVTRYDYAGPGGPPCCAPTAGSSLVTRVEDANGRVTFYKYDALDRLVASVRKVGDTNDVIDPDDVVVQYAYDAENNRISETDPLGLVTTYTYDGLNRRTSSTNAAGEATLYSYDPVGNLITNRAPNGNVTEYVYDGLDRRIRSADSAGVIVTNTYDAVGNLVARTDALGHTTTYTYDGLNRRVTETDPLGGTTTTTYDAVGNVTSRTDPLGHVTTYAYDGLNRSTNMTDALGNTTTYTYDGVGNLLSVTDPNGHSTTYGYDALNRRVSVTYADPAPNTRVYVYDGVGNVVARTNQDGRVTLFGYDELDRMTNRTYSTDPPDNLLYDLAGRLVYAERAGWVETFVYDAANRLVTNVVNGRTITYAYDIPNRKRTVKYPGGKIVEEQFDARDRLISVTDVLSGVRLAEFGYNAADHTLFRTNANGTATTNAYNPNNWLTNIAHWRGGTLLAGFAHAYDADGNKLTEAKLHMPLDSEAYRYDPLHRLTNYAIGTLVGTTIPAPAIQKAWQLDPVGNWNSLISNSIPEPRFHNAVNELTNLNGTPLLYDDNGNLVHDGVYAYAYDGENRLTQVVRLSDSAVVGQYWYDALGRRVVSVVNPAGTATTNLYFYDAARIIEEQTPGGATVATYTYGNYVDEVLTMDRSGQTYYYHANALWSPHALTDSSGAVVERYTYDAYGGVTVLDAAYTPLPLNAWGTPHSAVGNPWLFTGRQLDEESGLYYYRTRHYHPGQGRFIQRDSLGYVTGLNLYEYVRSSPTRYVDPSGMSSQPATDPSRSSPSDRTVSGWVKKKRFFPALMKVGNCCYKVSLEAEWEERRLNDAADREVIEWRNLRYTTVSRTQPVWPVACSGAEIGEVASWGGQWQQWNPPWKTTGRATAPDRSSPDSPRQAPPPFAEAAPAGTEGPGGYMPQMLGD